MVSPRRPLDYLVFGYPAIGHSGIGYPSVRCLVIGYLIIGSLLCASGCSSANQNVVPYEANASTAAFVTEPATTEAAIAPIAPTTQPRAARMAEVFDTELSQLLSGGASDPQAAASLPPDERALLATVIESVASFRRGLREETSLMAARVAPLIDLSDRIRSQTPLTLPIVALCKSVTQFGSYDPIAPARFAAGQETPVIVYCEVDNFDSRNSTDNQWQTKLSYEAVLYSDNDHSVAVAGKKPTIILDHCRNRRRDFFLADRFTLPATLPVGKYVLKVTVIDQLANHVAEKTTPILIAPN